MRSEKMRLLIGWMVLGVVSTPVLFGQDAKPAGEPSSQSTADGTSKILVNANLVVLPVVVRDKKGALVNGLAKDDFALKIKDKPVVIKYFDHDNDVPLTLGLLVDVSRSMRDKTDEERTASEAFLQTMLTPASGKREADKAFVVQFAKQIELLQDVTDQRPPLEKALQELGTESPQFHTAEDPDTTDSEGRKVHHGGTALYDALFLSSDELQSKQKGRKALVVLTDGVDVGSKESLTEAIESAQEADTIVYAIYYRGTQRFDQNMGNPSNRRSGGYPGGGYPGGGYPGGGYPGGGYPGGGYPGNNPNGGGNGNPNGGGNGGPGGGSRKPSVDGRQVLERICGETGGRVFEVSKKQTVEEIYTQIAEELRSEYRLGFTPDETQSRYGFHPIDLNMSNPDQNKKLDIQTRSGYYGGDTH
jgi:VWFA-related protein